VSWQNLLKIGQLKEHPPSAEEIQQLLAAAQRNLADARVREVSAETRFAVRRVTSYSTTVGASRRKSLQHVTATVAQG